MRKPIQALHSIYFAFILGVVSLLGLAGCKPGPAQTEKPATQTAPMVKTTSQALAASATRTPTHTPSPKPPSFEPRLIATLGKGTISGVYRTPDGKKIVSVVNNEIKIVDGATFQELYSIESKLSSIDRVVFNQDGSLAALSNESSGNPFVEIIDLNTGKLLPRIHGEDDLGMPVLSPDGKFVIFISSPYSSRDHNERINVWNLEKGELAYEYNPSKELFRHEHWAEPAVSPDGKIAATGYSDTNVYVWDIETGETLFVLKGHADFITNVAFSPDGKILASSSYDGTIRLWDPHTGSLIRIVTGFKDSVFGVRFSSDGKYLFTQRPEHIWDMEKNQFVSGELQPDQIDPYIIAMHRQGYFDYHPYSEPSAYVKISPNGRLLAMGKRNILIWDLQTHDLVQSLEFLDAVPGLFIYPLTFDSLAKYLAAKTSDDDLVIWEIASGEVLWQQNRRQICKEVNQNAELALSTNNSRVYFSCDSSIQIWDFTTNQVVAVLDTGQDTFPTNIYPSDNGESLYVALEWGKAVQVWNLATFHMENQIDFSLLQEGDSQDLWKSNRETLNWPHFARIVENGENYKLELWDLEKGQKTEIDQPEMDGPTWIEFNPSGSLLLSDIRGSFYVWRVETGELFLTVKEPPNYDFSAISLVSNISVQVHEAIAELWDISAINNAAQAKTIAPPATITPSRTDEYPYSSATSLPTQGITPRPLIPLPKGAIQPENAASLKQLSSIGWGTVEELRWLSGGKQFLAAGSGGLFQYDAQNLNLINRTDNGLWNTSAAFLPDGALRSVGKIGSTMKVWDQNKGMILVEEDTEGRPVISLDGNFIKYYTGPWTYFFYNLETQEIMMDRGGGVFSPDGRLAAESNRVWDLQSGVIINTLAGPQDRSFNDQVFSQDSQWVAAVIDGEVWIWNALINGPAEVLELYPLTQIKYPDDPQEVIDPPHPTIRAVAMFDHSSRLAAATSDRKILLIDLESKQVVDQLEAVIAPIYKMIYSPDGRYLLASDEDGGLYLWEMSTLKLIAQNHDHSGKIRGLRFTADGSLFSWERNTVWKINPRDGKILASYSIPSGWIFDIDPVREEAVVYEPYQLSIWKLSTGSILRTLEGHPGSMEEPYNKPYRDYYSAKYSSDGQYLIAAGTGGEWLYKVNDGKLIYHYRNMGSEWAAFSPDNRRLAFCTILPFSCFPEIYDLSSHELIQSTEGDLIWPGYAVFSPDGLQLLGSDGSVWDTVTGKLLFLGPDFRNRISVASSPDGRLTAYGWIDGRIELVDAESYQRISWLEGSRGENVTVAFSPDGRYLVSGGADGTVKIWGIP